jgi:hypothetical protein
VGYLSFHKCRLFKAINLFIYNRVNFKKNERKYEPNNSEVLRMVQEVDQEPRDPEPEGKLAEFEYKENLRNIRNGAIQSNTFKRLQAALQDDKGRK